MEAAAAGAREAGAVMHGTLPSAPPSSRTPPAAELGRPVKRPPWQLAALVLFACIDVAAIGIFFVVFIGVVISPPAPRSTAFVLVTGGFAFAVLVLGQFFHWSRLALRVGQERRS